MNISPVSLGALILIKAKFGQGFRILLNTTNQISQSWPLLVETCSFFLRRTLGIPPRVT